VHKKYYIDIKYINKVIFLYSVESIFSSAPAKKIMVHEVAKLFYHCTCCHLLSS